MAGQDGFDFGGVDVLSAGDDDVLDAVDDPGPAVLAGRDDVSGAEPSVGGEAGRGVLVTVPIAGEEVGAPDEQFAGRSGGDRGGVVAGLEATSV